MVDTIHGIVLLIDCNKFFFCMQRKFMVHKLLVYIVNR